MNATTALRQLPALNDNYTPARPWTCVTRAAHTCSGPVIGAIGAIPVCAAGADAEQAAREAEAQRIAELLATPEMQATLREEARIERWIEARA